MMGPIQWPQAKFSENDEELKKKAYYRKTLQVLFTVVHLHYALSELNEYEALCPLVPSKRPAGGATSHM